MNIPSPLKFCIGVTLNFPNISALQLSFTHLTEACAMHQSIKFSKHSSVEERLRNIVKNNFTKIGYTIVYF